MKCTNCRKEIEAEGISCKYCASTKPQQGGKLFCALAVVVLVCGVAGCNSASQSDKNSGQGTEQTSEPKNGDVFSPDGIEMVFIEGTGKDTRLKPSESYYIGKYEVTQAQWREVMGSNPSCFVADNNPVEMISWDDANEFIAKLNQKTGRTYAMPTQAQWKYAAQGGSSNDEFDYAGSDNLDEVAWFETNGGSKTHAVGQKKPNSIGIFDMSGNVWEWCEDCYLDDCADRTAMGGSWSDGAPFCTVTSLTGDMPSRRNGVIGLRLVLIP